MPDLVAITKDYLAAFEERDVQKCLSFFGDDAVVDFQNVEYQGYDALKEWHEERFAANLRMKKIDNVKVKGTTVIVDLVASSDRLAAWKIHALKSKIEAKFEGEKIQEVKLTAKMDLFAMMRSGE